MNRVFVVATILMLLGLNVADASTGRSCPSFNDTSCSSAMAPEKVAGKNASDKQ